MPSDVPDHAHDPAIPALAGLRFIAAILVAIVHSGDTILRYEAPPAAGDWLPRLGPVAMTVFFVLSGFIVHFRYRHVVTVPGWRGLGAVAQARFGRRDPLFQLLREPLLLLLLVFAILLGHQLLSLATGGDGGPADAIRSLPYFLLFVQNWAYVPLDHTALGSFALSWPIATEILFYLGYPALALLAMRARRPIPILGTMLVWGLLWVGLSSSLFGGAQDPESWVTGHFAAIDGLIGDGGDPFFRWLLYFSPGLRICEFFLGCLTAQLYLQRQDRSVIDSEETLGGWLILIGLTSVALVLYVNWSGDNAAAALASLRNSFILAPSVALGLYGAARSTSGLSRLFRSRPLVALGDAANSFALAHALLLILILGYLGQALPATAPIGIFLALRFIYFLSLAALIALALYGIASKPVRRQVLASWHAGGARRSAVVALPAAAALLWLGIQTYQLQNQSGVAAGIRLISATYGGNCGAQPGNATDALVAACDGQERCDYTVDVEKLGDPVGGCSKDFKAAYVCRPGHVTQRIELPGEAGLGSHAIASCAAESLPEPAAAPHPSGTQTPIVARPARGIDILSATYGGNCGAASGNATTDVQATCAGKSSCTYSVDVSRLGDPASGCQKDFATTYQCAGKPDSLTRQLPPEAGFGGALELACP